MFAEVDGGVEVDRSQATLRNAARDIEVTA
jgi:hypothetical protein